MSDKHVKKTPETEHVAIDEARLRELQDSRAKGLLDDLIVCGAADLRMALDALSAERSRHMEYRTTADLLIASLKADLRAERERGDRAVGLADYAAHDDDCTVNRYPGHDACSCGLSPILQAIRHDLATQKAEV